MGIRAVLSGVLILALPSQIMARLVEPWTYREMFDRADLVAIASVVSSKDTDERRTLASVRVIGVVTDFKVCLTLKAEKQISTFRLHHYRLELESDEDIENGPALVRIGQYHPVFLLFLVKEPDGGYAPVTGQADPAMFSVLRLNGAALGSYGPP